MATLWSEVINRAFLTQKHLFENAFYILVHNESANDNAFEIIQELLKTTDAKFISTTAEEHDFVTGIVSHVPHIIASSLVHLNAEHVKDSPLVKTLAVVVLEILLESLVVTLSCGVTSH